MHRLTGVAPEIVDVLAQFEPKYHAGFASVRPLARDWLRVAGRVPDVLPARVATVLREWGAGTHKAPELSNLVTIESTLAAAQPLLSAVEQLDLFSIGRGVPASRRQEIDRLVLEALWALTPCFELHSLATGHSVTYPSKLLMLLTGRYIGLDSNVRAGLRALWQQKGYSATQFLLPRLEDSRAKEAEKIARVFWLVAEYLAEHEHDVRAGVTASCRPLLLDELDAPSRVVDVLLFVAGKGSDASRAAG